MRTKRNKVAIVVLTPLISGKPARVGGIQTRISNYLRLLPSHGVDPILISVGSGATGNQASCPILSLSPGLRSVFHFLKVASSQGIKVVHILEGSLSVFPILLLAASRLAGLATCLSYYGGEISEGMRSKGLKLRIKAGLAVADLVLCNSEATRRLVPRSKLPETVIIYPGADRTMLERLPAEAPPKRRTGLILFVGRMGKRKGAVDLVKAFVKLHAKVPWARLAIVGDGPARNIMMVREEIRKAQVSGQVELVGRIDHDDPRLAQLYATAEVFSMPAKETDSHDVEGFGCVFLEAALFGTPSVSTRHFGIPEAIVDGRTGMLADGGDVDSLAEMLERVLVNPKLRSKLGKNAKERTFARFLDDHSAASLASAYRRLGEIQVARSGARQAESDG